MPPVSRYLSSGESSRWRELETLRKRLAQEDQGHVGHGEERRHDQRQPGQVLLHDGGAGHGPAYPAAERGRETSAFARVQEDEPYEGDAEHGVKESQYVYHALTLSHGGTRVPPLPV